MYWFIVKSEIYIAYAAIIDENHSARNTLYLALY